MKHPRERSWYVPEAGQLQGKKQVVYTSESSSTELNYLNVKVVRTFINAHIEKKDS